MTMLSHLEAVNDHAQRATADWTATKGITAELLELRLEGDSGPVPAPGLLELIDSIDEHLRLTVEASDLAHLLAGDPNPDEETFERFFVAAEVCQTEGALVGRVHRDIAQLALGISSRLGGSGRVERLDRAAVAALHPPLGRWVGLIEDGVKIPPLTLPQLEVVLGGLICRMLIDRQVLLVLDEVTLFIDDGETLLLGIAGEVTEFDSPVQVSTPAHEVAKRLEEMNGADPLGRITIQIASASWFAR